MEEQPIKTKSILEKAAPFILIILVIFLGYFGLSKINIGGGSIIRSNSNAQESNQVQVDGDFLNSDTFKALRFVPDSSVFDEATGLIPAGKDNPFAP
ncbi:MAG: hypothetical protein PHH21_00655 [Candidatus Pacebacteria bacterium]|nr:hypothetical protein [Candidatus Paceibacterota bacterium]